MIDRRKRILFTIFGGIILMASGISTSYAQGSKIEFAGRWNAILIMNGHKAFTLTMVQNGDQVTGTFPGNGTIEGTISGRVLRFRWRSDSGGTGSGRFVMEEKQFAFSGTYNRGDNPDDVDNTWSGRRDASPDWRPFQKLPPGYQEPQPIPGKRSEGEPDPMGKMSEAEYARLLAEYEERQKNAPATFDGVWQTKSGDKFVFPQLLLQQHTSNKVVGHLYGGRPDLGVIKDGIVDRNTLRFTVWRPNPTALPWRRSLPDIQVGIGELVMDADGKSFRGTILGATITSATLIAR